MIGQATSSLAVPMHTIEVERAAHTPDIFAVIFHSTNRFRAVRLLAWCQTFVLRTLRIHAHMGRVIDSCIAPGVHVCMAS